jgi:hypothetical protein
MPNSPYPLDFLQRLVSINFGDGAWLLISADISGFVDGSATPPPYGSFSWDVPPNEKFLAQQILNRTQTSNPGKPTTKHIYYLWSGVLSLPIAANYSTLIQSPDALPAFATAPLAFTYGNQFSVILSDTGTGDFSSLAAAAAAIPTANAFGSHEALPMWQTDNTDFFNFPTTFSANTLTITTPPVPSGSTVLNSLLLFRIPAIAAKMNFTAVVPPNSSVAGWASVFTKQSGPVTKVSDLKGIADQTVDLSTQSSTHTYAIATTGKSRQGTVSVDGSPGVTPGLPPNAPP